MKRYVQNVKMQRCIVGPCEHRVTVRNISGRYHVRVLLNGEVNQEAICGKANIGFTARSLLRWEDKCGNISQFATSARAPHEGFHMKTMIARYPGKCIRTGFPINPGDLIVFFGKGKAYLATDSSPSLYGEDIDPDLALASSIDPESAVLDPVAAQHAGRYLRESMRRGVSDIWRTSTGREYYRNRRGLCEDAPCCGCCNA